MSINENDETIMHVTDKEKVECLNDNFCSISSAPNVQPELPDLMQKINSKLESITITEDEIIDILKSLNIRKASGPDLISNRMLKSIAVAIARPLTI